MNTSSKPQLIGLAGTFCGGKDTLAEHMVQNLGYTHVSTGDMVREVAQRDRGSIERPILVEVANEYRHKQGAGALVELSLEKPRPLIITGLRSLGEAKAIKAAGGLLVFIDADPKQRYEWMRGRHRDGEVKLTFDEFLEGEQKEWYAGDADADFNLRDIQKMADVQIYNDSSTLQEFFDLAYDSLSLA